MKRPNACTLFVQCVVFGRWLHLKCAGFSSKSEAEKSIFNCPYCIVSFLHYNSYHCETQTQKTL